MAKRGKKYIEAKKKVENRKYDLEEAIKLALDIAYASFDETVDVAIRLGVNPKYSDQMVRGGVALPNGLGREIRVIAFCKGEKQQEAQEAGADVVGAEDLVKKIQEGWLDFDKAVATPDMMSQVGKVGRILGPRGLMPNAKTGTVTFDIGAAIKELKKGMVEYKVDKAGIIHAPVGKVSFGVERLKENIQALLDSINKAKPSSVKGAYFLGMAVSTTMGPGIKIDASNISNYLE
jgi:large subunit ribosomal protein L1